MSIRSGCKWLVLCVAVMMIAALQPAAAQTTTTTTFPPVPVRTAGVGKAPPGAGMGTKAALTNPKCNASAVDGWGVFPFVTEAAGPFCVAPAPAKNGGATASGVTGDSIKVVVVLATDAQLAAQGSAGSQTAKNEATGAVGKQHDAILDTWPAFAKVYESWGRQVQFEFMDSSGTDEAAQRADAIKVAAAKPFAMWDSTPSGLSTLETVVAQDKILVYGSGTKVEDTIAQAPYRWGQTDQQSAAYNTATWAGKQLVGAKAQWAGDKDMQGKTRTFGAIHTDVIDIASFNAEFAKYKGKLATPALEYTTLPGVLGDPTSAQEQAPTLVTKLKTSGVTSVFLFSDASMNAAITKAATDQEYFPEWLLTGYQFADLSLLARNYDKQQWAHAFGLSNLFPAVKNDPGSSSLGPVLWYWGAGVPTSGSAAAGLAGWLAAGIQYAGPTLTANNFQKGYFAVPARGGAASDDPASFMVSYGKTAGLPYDQHMSLGNDFAPVWYDANTTGESQSRPVVAQGVTMYVNGGKRYSLKQWPKETFKFFDPTGAVYVFATQPVPLAPTIPCTGCPSQGGAGTPAASKS